MARTFTVQTTIARPRRVVFEAIRDSEVVTQYFVDRTSGSLEAGARVVWHWDAWGDYPVEVDAVEPYERIVLRLNAAAWKKTEDDAYDVRVDIELETLDDGRTMLRISESGWKDDAAGIKASYENCGGWQHMMDCCKAWLEHGINLRAHHAPTAA